MYRFLLLSSYLWIVLRRFSNVSGCFRIVFGLFHDGCGTFHVFSDCFLSSRIVVMIVGLDVVVVVVVNVVVVVVVVVENIAHHDFKLRLPNAARQLALVHHAQKIVFY